MKVLVIGSNGFIGSQVVLALASKHEVYCAARGLTGDARDYSIDLEDPRSIKKVLINVKPEVIVNCAGVVDNSEKAQLNPIFTANLIDVILSSGIKLKQLIISGSASEYGVVDAKNIPVSEDVPLYADSGYGLSKLNETKLALEARAKHTLPIVVARIFNPIGLGMHERLLIPRIIKQIQEIKQGSRDEIEISRLDTKRDYISVKDVALAISTIVGSNPKETVYNIGSGKSTTTRELIDFILRYINLPVKPKIVETLANAEPIVAECADISRIHKEFGWKPLNTVEATVKEIVNATK